MHINRDRYIYSIIQRDRCRHLVGMGFDSGQELEVGSGVSEK